MRRGTGQNSCLIATVAQGPKASRAESSHKAAITMLGSQHRKQRLPSPRRGHFWLGQSEMRNSPKIMLHQRNVPGSGLASGEW